MRCLNGHTITLYTCDSPPEITLLGYNNPVGSLAAVKATIEVVTLAPSAPANDAKARLSDVPFPFDDPFSNFWAPPAASHLPRCRGFLYANIDAHL